MGKNQQNNSFSGNNKTATQGATDATTSPTTAGSTAAGSAQDQSATQAVQSAGSDAGAAQSVQSGPADGAGSAESSHAVSSSVPGADTVADQATGGVVTPPYPRGQTPYFQHFDELAVFDPLLSARPDISAHAIGLLQDFDAYVGAMPPTKPMSQAEGATHQRRLFRTLQGIVNDLDGIDFEVAFGHVLATVEANDNHAFDDLAVFRFFDAKEMILPTEDRLAFRNFLNFLLKIAPAKSRATVASQVNLNATFANRAFTDAGRSRVQAYCRID